MFGKSCFGVTPEACTESGRGNASRSSKALVLPSSVVGLRARTLGLLLVTGIVLESSRLLADPDDTPTNPDSLSVGTDSAETSNANIVLIGTLASDHELVLLLRELLDRQGVAIEVTSAARFDPEALFADRDEGGAIRVFVTLREGRRARLYFRGPTGDRYLLRKLRLPRELDAVGRELLGQVVESSVIALLRSSQGISREQATQELARDSAPSPPARTAPRTVRRNAPLSQPDRWEPHAAVRYAAQWSGADLGLAHGPGGAVGVRRRSRWSVGFELAGERFFERALSVAPLEASVQKTSIHALFELGAPVAPPHALGLALGPALEISRIRPIQAAPEVTLAGPATNLVPTVRLELRYEVTAGPLSIGALALADIALARTHYDFEEAGVKRELAAPWLLRPGAALSIGVKP